MPWDIHKEKGGYVVTSKVSGRTAHIKSKAGLRGYLWHAEHGNNDKLHRAVTEVRRGIKAKSR